MTLPVRTDVLVVGGGPAGSSAATFLAKKGYSVVLIDKAHHPRETVGESGSRQTDASDVQLIHAGASAAPPGFLG